MSDPKSEPKSEQKSSPKGEPKDNQKGEQKPEQKSEKKKNLDYEQMKAQAPKLLAEMVHMLLLWRKMGFNVPRGVKNIFEFTWDELMVLPPRKSFSGIHCPVVKFLSPDEADMSSAATSRAQRVPTAVGAAKPNYVTPSLENQQMLIRFQKRSVQLLSELLKMKMKIMIDAVAGTGAEEAARRFLEGGRQLSPRTREEANEFMIKEPRRRGRGMVPAVPAIQISSTTQLIQQMSFSCLCFSLAFKDSKTSKGSALFKGKSGSSTFHEKEGYDERLDPCPEAREKLREICRHMEEEKAAALAKGHNRPLILRNYTIVHKSPSQALKRASLSHEIRRFKGKKMFFSLPDGTVTMYYPSGSLAICQFPICCIGRTVTLLFQDAPSHMLLASFTSHGHSCVRYCFRSSCSVALLMNPEGGSVRDKDGYLIHHWSWYSKTQVLQSIDFQINEQIKLNVLNQSSMTLTFTALNESITISLVRPGCVHGSKMERQLSLRNVESDDKDGHWARSLAELRRRFEKIMRQFINCVLMVSGICCIDYPLEFSSTKHVKFSGREAPFHAWDRKPREEPSSSTSEVKTKTGVKPLLPQSLTGYLPFKKKQRPDSRAKTDSPAGDAVQVPEMWAASPTDCPVVLRRILAKEGDGVCCKCVVKVPMITDIEFEKFITAPRDPLQVIVICVLSPQNHSYSPFFEWSVEKIYVQMQHGRPSPCIQCKHDPFRFLKYDLESPLNQKPPLLVQKHGVVPGMVVMYAGGKLLFGSTVFNGYSYSKRDLLKQINQVCLDCKMGHFLPQSFKFSSTGEPPKAPCKPVESLYDVRIKEPLPEETPVVEKKKKEVAEKPKRVSSGRKKTKK
ncbi:hypothetical protein JRQ81_003102 [Phrynocephalus forsythii]|uniref:FAM194 C-terminal domain-containing protein n=1 Tax=Phrynocephalus forsythii TaxID=171643 RepID=A0A9Q0XK55_9SAUR|nr:hypothetical protein JRQ81_003102 [Phrynocephalus forsythii]